MSIVANGWTPPARRGAELETGRESERRPPSGDEAVVLPRIWPSVSRTLTSYAGLVGQTQLLGDLDVDWGCWDLVVCVERMPRRAPEWLHDLQKRWHEKLVPQSCQMVAVREQRLTIFFECRASGRAAEIR